MQNSRKLFTAALGAAMLAGAMSISTPASAWVGCGWGSAGFDRDWGTADPCGYIVSRPAVGWGRWGYYAPARRVYRYRHYRYR
jgi:hypothetical protein